MQLPDEFFSLGQDESYYTKLARLDGDIRDAALRSLNDVALDLELFGRAMQLKVTNTSLLRWVSPFSVRTQFHRIATGGARLSPFSFVYTSPSTDRRGQSADPVSLRFDVDPKSSPRSNVHVIIGSNGVGKSFILNDIANLLVRGEPGAKSPRIHFTNPQLGSSSGSFANVASVAFSAFDQFEPLRRQSTHSEAISYRYIGLKRLPENNTESSPGTKDHTALASDFGMSFKRCLESSRLHRWMRAVEILRSDPIFAEEAGLVLELRESHALRDEARKLFARLSSGHKIVMLTITRLVETVDEATLVLIDEPESHLHPPLLSSFMSALADLLENRNGVAIIATHSPVVLQEIPKHCAWVLRSFGGPITAQRPVIETYGENVSVLTQEVFGLEVTASGFHKAIARAAAEGGSAKDVETSFDIRLGSEARALLHAMTRNELR